MLGQAEPRRSRGIEPASLPAGPYRIGDLAQYTGLSRQTLHNYTRWGLINEVGWTAGGHRVYDATAFGRLKRILELKRKLSVAEIKVVLDRDDKQAAAPVEMATAS